MKPTMKKMRREAVKRTRINDRAFPRAWDDISKVLIEEVPLAKFPPLPSEEIRVYDFPCE
jgi:hypothetical protein